MKVIPLGTGEAFDENHPNTSFIVLSQTKLLLDCGYSVPPQVWKHSSGPSFLDAIYISHTHADHYFGIAPLLVRMWEDGRTSPLTIICPKGCKESIQKILHYGYGSVIEKFKFEINYIEVENNQTISLNELSLSFALTEHVINNLAISVSDGKKKICYGGDGGVTDEIEELCKNSNLLIAETFLFNQKITGHSCIKNAIKLTKESNINTLALTHIQRNFRKDLEENFENYVSEKNIKVIIPQQFEEINL